MRIALVAEVFWPKVDGVTVRTMNLIDQLRLQGDELLAILPAMKSRGDCGLSTIEFPSFPFQAYPEYLIGVPDERLPKAIRAFAPDVVHYINPFAFGFRCYDFIERSGLHLPSVFSFHTLFGEFAKRYGPFKALSNILWWLIRDYHNRASSNLTVSTIMQQELIERGFERVGFWPPAVDSAMFHPSRASPEMRNRLSDGHPRDPLLITVSRLAPEKNVQFLANVLERVPQSRLAIIGDGPQRAELESRFKHVKAKFFGYMKGEELAAAYASADAFVYASETETMGNVVLEAMASGLAVVAPRAGGIPSLFVHDHSGLLYAPGNIDEASLYTRRLVEDCEYRSALGAAARDRADKSDWKNAADSVRKFYFDTIAAHPSRPATAYNPYRLAPAVLSSLIFALRLLAKLPGQQPTAPAAAAELESRRAA